MKQDTWCIFDAGHLGHCAMHATGALSHDDVRTGVVYGFLNGILTVCCHPRFNTCYAAICFDSKHSLRKDALPSYKKKRHKDRTPEEWAEIKIMHKQLTLLRREILPDIGFPTLVQRGLESDDMMAQFAKQLTLADCFKCTEGLTAVMVTSDYDLLQCVTETIHWYDPVRKLYLDLHGVKERKGVLPCKWALVKAIAGCRSDKVKGVYGVGELTAAKFLAGNLKRTGKVYKRIVSNEGIAIKLRNLDLVQLPHAATKPVVVPHPIYDVKAFFKWARKLGFDSILHGERRVTWERFLAGDPLPIRDRTVEGRQQALLDRR